MICVTSSETHDQSKVTFGQLFLGAPALVLARRDGCEGVCKFVGRNPDPAFDLSDRLLSLFDSCPDIEQILAAAVDV